MRYKHLVRSSSQSRQSARRWLCHKPSGINASPPIGQYQIILLVQSCYMKLERCGSHDFLIASPTITPHHIRPHICQLRVDMCVYDGNELCLIIKFCDASGTHWLTIWEIRVSPETPSAGFWKHICSLCTEASSRLEVLQKIGMCGNRILFRFLKTRTEAKRSNWKLRFLYWTCLMWIVNIWASLTKL